MKIYLRISIALFSLSMLFSCSSDAPPKDTTENAEEPDRNMFGMGMPRGLINKGTDLTPGYVMHVVPNSGSTYLLDRDGQVVHEWKSNYGVQGAYLMDDGSIFVNAYDVDFPIFAGGGESGRLQEISWESKILWDFEYADEKEHHHHDFAVMPNGNVLAIAWEARSAEEVLAAGRKPQLIPEAGLWPDKVVEIKPLDKYHGEIVWEWHVWDHLVQDHDPSKDNYGDPVAHPELLDFNVGRPLPPPITQDSMDILQKKGTPWRNQTAYNRGSDVYHFNAINYNPTLDQIVLSSPNLSEVFIIDHSTTSDEAAGHSGGRYGQGGDFLYRWGNPQNYRHGDSTDQVLHHQHDIRWIEEGKPGAGNLTVFNNDIPNGPDSMAYSAVFEITPPQSQPGRYSYNQGEAYGPEETTWEYVAEDTISFYSGFISGAHRMQNGNTFINEGAKARFFEVSPEGDILWEYWVQHRGNIHKPNGDPMPVFPFTFIQFRSTFIPVDHPGLAGKELVPLDPQPAPFIPPERG